MREGDVISGALLRLGTAQHSLVYQQLLDMPRIAGIGVRQSMLDSFHDMLDRSLLVFTFINTLLGSLIAFGVVYNMARITFAERERELASLRVLGYRHHEVAYILLMEILIITLLAIPLGFAIGYQLCAFVAAGLQSELFRVPLIVTPFTYGMSAAVILLATGLCCFYLWQKLKTLDLVEVLKARE
jgi:putative ABC transport system permease protein